MAAPAKKMTPASTNKQSAALSVVANKTSRPAPAARTTKPRLSVVGQTPTPKPQDRMPHWALAALENSRANTFLCDKDFNIVYANKKAMDILEFMQPNLRKFDDWRHFVAADIVGMNLDFLFTDEPVEFRRAADPRNHPYRSQIRTGPCVCDVQVTSIRDNKGELAGYAVDWERITDKLVAEKHQLQLTQALDGANTNIMMVDNDFNLIYMNANSRKTLKAVEPELKAVYGAGFNVDELMGRCIDAFHKNPSHQRNLVKNEMAFPIKSNIQIGPLTLSLTVSAVKDKNGTVISYCAEWEEISAKIAAEKRQIQLMQALDGANTNIMMVDTDFNLMYMNTNSRKTLKAVEPELKAVYGSSFNVDELMGRCIDAFHKNPSHQRNLVKNEMAFPIQSQIKIGPLTLSLTVSAVKDKNGTVISYCAEWEEITAKLAAEEEQKRRVEEGQYLATKIDEMMGVTQALAAGDLTQTIPVEKEDGIGRLAMAFNDMVQNLSQLVAQASFAADNIVQSSTEVSMGTDDLSQRTSEQASSLEETASSMEEMTSTVKQNADNARQANQLAAQASEVAVKGGQVVSSAVTSMEEINKASKRIADIISVIDEIAFQTNLLALNAAVEAARVGEQGRGFAVVAAEVRNLAGRSATAAKEIKALVQDSVAKVQEGSNLVNQSGQTLNEIVNSVKKVADIISEITAASQEQSAGIEQVNKAIMQMDQITQQNASLVEEAAAASQAMTQQANDLQGLVSKFQLDASYIHALQQTAAPAVAVQHKASAPAPGQSRFAPTAQSARRAITPTRTTAAPTRAKADEFEEF